MTQGHSPLRALFVTLGLLYGLYASAQNCNVSINSISTVCPWSTVNLNTTVTSTGATSYAWAVSGGSFNLLSPTTNPSLTLQVISGPVSVTLTVTDANSPPSCTDNLTINTHQNNAALSGLLNGNALTPVSNYGPQFPTFVLCQDPVPASANFVFNDNSPAGVVPLSIGVNGNFITPPSFPWTQSFGPGLDTVFYVTQNTNTGCTDTAMVGVLLGVPAAPQLSTNVAGPNELCLPNAATTFSLSSQTLTPPGTVLALYTNEPGVPQPVDILVAPFPATYDYTFSTVPCGPQYTSPPFTNTFTFTIVPSYGCPNGSLLGNTAQPIRVSEPPAVSATSPSEVCVGQTVQVNAQASGQWIDVLGGSTNSTCQIDPYHYWAISPGIQGGAWTVSNNLGSNNGSPGQPSAWTSGSDPLSVVFNTAGIYDVTIYGGGSDICPTDDFTLQICVQDSLDIGFTYTLSDPCVPATVNLNDTTDYTNSCNTETYNWIVQAVNLFCGGSGAVNWLPNAAAQTSQSPQFELLDPGEYMITQQIVTPCGTETATSSVTVYGPPAGNMNPLPVGPCVGDVMPLTGSYAGCGLQNLNPQYSLITGNATINGGVLTVTGPGQIIYQVQVNDTCSGGLLTLDIDTVSAQAPPTVPQVSINPDPVCEGDSVTITITPQAGVSIYSISSPGSGWSVNSNTATIVATSALNGPIIVTAGTPGCGQSATVNLTVIPITPISISPSPASLCQGDSVTLTASGGGTNYIWTDLNTGSSTSGNPYTTGPMTSTTIVLTDSIGGCLSSDTTTITVNVPQAAVAPPSVTLCADGVAYQLPSAGAGAVYSSTSAFFFAPDMIVPTPSIPANFYVLYTLTDANGCISLDSTHIIIDVQIAAPNAGPDSTICINEGSLNLTASGIWVDIWPYFIGGVFDPLVSGGGVFTVTDCALACVNICDEAIITVLDTPTISFGSIPSFCVGDPGQQLIAGPFPGIWYGQGPISPTGFWDNSVAIAGTYTVCFSMTDTTTTCSSDSCIQINVAPPPVAAIGPISGCAGTPITFANNGGGSSWDWFVNGTILPPAFQPTYIFPTGGNYTIQLIAYDGSCSSATSTTVFIDSIPVAAVTWNVVDSCGQGIVSVTNNSSYPGATHQWLINGVLYSAASSPGTLTVPAYPVLNDTTYQFTYLISGPCGSDPSYYSLTLRPLSVSAFVLGVPTFCLDDSLLFSNQSYGTVDSMFIDWGDNMSSTSFDSIQYHSYDTAGTYLVQLTTYGPCGQADSSSQTITVLPNQVDALIGVSDLVICAGQALTVFNGSIGDTAIVIYFNDAANTTSTNINGATLIYPDPGFYTIVLDALGCGLDSDSVLIEVQPQPTIMLPSDTTICLGETLPFSVSGVGFVGIIWDFGNGDSAFVQSTSYTYPASGTYQVSVTVQSSSNLCSTIDSMTVNVDPTPLADFTVSDSVFCVPKFVQFNNSSTPGLSYTWYVDNVVHSFQYAPPAFQFLNPGPHTISLTVQNQLTGCTDSTSFQVFGNQAPSSSFVLDPIDSCATSFYINATNTSTVGSSALWYVNNVQVASTFHLNMAYTGNTGSYVVMLVSGGFGNCTDTAFATFYLAPVPEPSFQVQSPICAGTPLAITNDSQTSAFYEWFWPDSGYSVSTTPDDIVFSSAGLYQITLIATSASGCTRTFVDSIYIYPIATILSASGELSDDQCGIAEFRGNTDTIAQYAWFLVGSAIGYGAALDLDLDELVPCANLAGVLQATLGPCLSSRPFTLVSGPDDICIYVPNAFSPDGDGKNEYFEPHIRTSEPIEFWIFNRWGEELFYSNDRYPSWNGTYKDKIVEEGVYVWRVLTGNDDCEREAMGHVTVVR